MALRKKSQKKAQKKTGKKEARKAKGVAPIPKGFHTVTTYLTIANCKAALEFYKRAFGAKELFRLMNTDGRLGHAEMRIGDSIVMIADEYPPMNLFGPREGEPTSIRLHLAVKDVDRFVATAVKAGAKLTRPVQDQFYGSRSGGLTDPYGHMWMVSTQIEVISPKKMQKRWDDLQAMMASSKDDT